jgi:SAM-dependent methyltransferase
MFDLLDQQYSDKVTRTAISVTSRSYDEMAESYAETTEGYAGYPGLRDEVIGFERSAPAGGPVLDLGCGGGRDGRLLSGLGRRIVAADISGNMLACARRRSPRARGMGFARANMLALPFADGRFAGVWASASLLHLPAGAIPRALSEVLRTLVSGGVAAVSMRSGGQEGWRSGGSLPGSRWFTLVHPLGFAEAMVTLGFTAVEIRHSGREGWFVAVGRK